MHPDVTQRPSAPLRLLHIAKGEPVAKLFTETFRRELSRYGEFRIERGCGGLAPGEIAGMCRASDVLVTGWGSVELPTALATDRGRVRYICHVTGTLRGYVPEEIVESGVPVTNWGDAPAHAIAEGAMALLLACAKILPGHVLTRRAGQWWPQDYRRTATLRGLRIGLYGYGAIGRRFHELIRPFAPRLYFHDPYVTDAPDDIGQLDTLDELFASSDALVIHAALTDSTRGSVDARRLAMLPDGGIVVNTARGDIIDQEALFAELASGRLRAALDVLAGADTLPEQHPARQWGNLILTGHQVGESFWPDPERLQPWHENALENLRRFSAGLPLLHRMTPERYLLST